MRSEIENREPRIENPPRSKRTLVLGSSYGRFHVSDLPTGMVTFLFTDIEGSTRLWERYPDDMPAALERHDSIMTKSIADYAGVVFRTVGDAFFAAFGA